MQNQRPHPRQNIQTICWKCYAENNLAVSKFCYKCNSNLELFVNKNVRFKNKKPSIFGAILKITLLISTLLILVGIFSIRFISPQYPEISAYKPLAYISGTTSNGSQTIKLPVNSWYNDNPLSYVRYYPTVAEIIQKNNEVVGNSMSLDKINTLSIAGVFSISNGECNSKQCFENNRESMVQQSYIEKPTSPKLQSNSDAGFELTYKEIGTIGTYFKKPGKLLRKIKVSIPHNVYKSSEITEGFDSNNGWKSTLDLNKYGQTFLNVEELDDLKINNLKDDLSSMWEAAYISSNSFKFKDIGKTNDRVVFILTKENKNKKVETFYFDSITGQAIKMESDGIAVFFDNFKKFDGITLPATIYSRKVESNGAVMWLKLDQIEWKFNEQFDDSIFEKPSQNQTNSVTKTPQ